MDLTRRALLSGVTALVSGGAWLVAGADDASEPDPEPEFEPEPTPDSPATTEAPPDDLTGVPADAERVWPVATDAGDTCTTANGEVKPATGEGAATWVAWNDCGTYKEFAVTPGEPVYVHAHTDSASLTDARFDVLARTSAGWRQVYDHDRRLGDDSETVVTFVPKTDRIRIANAGTLGFYMRVYQ